MYSISKFATLPAMVNYVGQVIEPEVIVDYLKRQIRLKEICQRVLCQQIISQEAVERGVEVTPAEVQTEANQQRHQRRLESAEATFAWLADQLITPENWEAGIRDRLLTKKLSERLFASEANRYFAEHRLEFEQISLYRIIVPYQQLAQELRYRIEEGEVSFYEAAHLYDLDERRRLQCGYEGKLYRRHLTPDIAAIVLGARPNEVIGPIQSEQGYDLLMVSEFIAPEMTGDVYQGIVDRLFQEWLEGELNYLLHHTNSN